MRKLTSNQLDVLCDLLKELINQEKAEIIISAEKSAPGFWFGGGKLARDQSGTIWLSGRYRNAGDLRTGLEAGVRGAECAIFRSDDGGKQYGKVQNWTKAQLSSEGREVISIEGTALHQCADQQWELYISTEKNLPYPESVRHYQKPGTGVWGIDRITGPSPDAFEPQTQVPLIENKAFPAYLHVKDPVVFNDPEGQTILIFCSHPYCWSSDNSGYAVRKSPKEPFAIQEWEMVPRGATWDVAVTRITSRFKIPRLGVFADTEPASVYFYDGAECMRDHQENIRAHKRPRGHSCEEIGGAFVGREKDFPEMERLSELEPLFVSPWGTGASRYVDCLVTPGGLLTIWQQSQDDGSQPLVRHFLPMAEVAQILTKE